jgi:transmembrane sensor
MPLMSDPTESAVSGAPAPEALAWLNRLLSGTVTPEDANAFKLWRGQSPAHEAAFADAVRLRRMVRRAVQVRDAEAAMQAGSPRPGARRVRDRVDPRRRAFLLGSGAAAAVAASYALVVRSDLLTDGLAALTSDYSTGVGERRSAAVTTGVSLELNTRTRVALLKAGGPSGIELKAGEALVSADRPGESAFVVAAAKGRTTLSQGQVNVRGDGEGVCVTCLAGEARVEYGGRRAWLTAGDQVRYGDRGLGATEAVDTTVTSAWRKGLLIFRDTPLQSVVDELNRYRPGKIFLVGEALARRPVYGVFRTSQIGAAIDQIRDLTGARLVDLPGGVVLLR